MRRLTLFCLAAVAFAMFSPTATAQCSPPNLVEWPAGNPVWKLCWVSPADSAGPDGSGLEIRHAFYRGKRVFWRANMPVLNVKYDSGATCGPTYRDWLDSLRAFDANNVLSPGYAEPTTPPTTVCDHPGTDAGSFSGVAVEKLRDRLILTSQTQAGWYRYINKWIFYLDGTIEPQFGFTAVDHPCVNQAHTHHGYWRFDLDVEGAANDSIRERRRFWFLTWWSTLSSESRRNRNSSNSRWWRVRDNATRREVEIRPGIHDTPADSFGGGDVWALRYRGTETDDGGSTGGISGDAQHIDQYLNGEAINGTDVVLWYRIGHRHGSGLACTMVGPRLRLLGTW